MSTVSLLLADFCDGSVREMVAAETFGERLVTKILGRELGLR